jgi:flavin reductase (DIM6/NTAB) family NADH-FMN oxidoreductase RutF
LDKFENVPFLKRENGCPILHKDTIAFLDCEVVNSIKAGDHTVFLGRVLQGKILVDISPAIFKRDIFI